MLSRPAPGNQDPDATTIIERIPSQPGGGTNFQLVAPEHPFPEEWRGVLLLAVAIVAHVVLTFSQPHFGGSHVQQLSLTAWVVVLASCAVVVFVRKAAGWRRIVLSVELAGVLGVIIFDGIHWVHLLFS